MRRRSEEQTIQSSRRALSTIHWLFGGLQLVLDRVFVKGARGVYPVHLGIVARYLAQGFDMTTAAPKEGFLVILQVPAMVVMGMMVVMR